MLLFTVVLITAAQSSANDGSHAQEIQILGYWTDPSTGLMWAGKDNGKDISYYKGIKYCRNLRLAGYSDWRLATMFELQPLYDKSVESPGRAGDGKGGTPRDFTWHVRGNLFLTGNEWSNNYQPDDRGKPFGWGWYFDFNEGKSTGENLGYSAGKRALCVRGFGDPLAGQRQRK